MLTPEHQTVEGVLNHFQRWMEHWKVREIFADKDMTQAQRRRRLKEFFNLTTEGVLTHGHDHQKEMVKE